MNNKVNDKTYIKLTPFKGWVLENFPFIESDFDCITNYQLLCKITEYLNNVIYNQNQVQELGTELVNGYNELLDYVNNYFDNLDVQSEISLKLDKMVEDGTFDEIIGGYLNNVFTPQINAQNQSIANIQAQVNTIGSAGTPIVVSSTSQMTDTTKLYVNTTDGYWYYYNGSAWVQGGVYQSTGLDVNSVHFNNLDENLTDNLFDYSTDVSNLGFLQWSMSSTSPNVSSIMYIKKGTTIEVSDDFVQNYHWKISRIKGASTIQQLFDYTTSTSYTFTNDELCVFVWSPIDNDWKTETYNVNRNHYLTNNDITSIKYYYPKIEDNFLIDLDYNLIQSLLCFAVHGTTLSTQQGRCVQSSNRVSITKPIKSKYPIRIDIKNGYDYGIVTYDSDDDDKVSISDSGWVNETRIIPANTYFTFCYREHNNASFATNSFYYLKDIIHLTSYGDFTYINEVIQNQGTADYYYNGEKLDTNNKYGFNIETLYAFDNQLGSSSQGFTIYGNYLIQLYDRYAIQLRNFTTNEVISNIEFSQIRHGDCCQFSNIFYDEDDLFPLLYVTSDETPGNVRVVRISNETTAELIEILDLGNSSGYYSGQCFDFYNNLIYSFGYKNQDYRTDTNGNEMIISVYNMNNKTLISDNRYSVELIDTYNIPFIYCIQGQKFFNGKCILTSSYLPAEQQTRIYVYDPIEKRITSTFTSFSNAILNDEVEDIDFVLDSNNHYYMVIGTRHYYYKVSFR